MPSAARPTWAARAAPRCATGSSWSTRRWRDRDRAHAFSCQTHLGSAGRTPVRHWIELVDEALA
ncbi:hypothetical protein ACFPTY_13440 [Halomonas beimenensis]|uniref:hypothetical protein n=1 Tax=Halomonas beimenensis TaxID=475662 RepID=UPI003616F479